jgi:hypothetical protein
VTAARYEYKYRIRPEQWARIRAGVESFLDADPLGDADGSYFVYSLYLDSWDWRTATEALEGLRSRFKLRARTYDIHGDGPIFLEVKGRVGTTILKTRAKVDRSVALTALGLPHGASLPNTVPPGLGAFLNLRDKLDMTPRIWVRYRREALVSNWGDDARLTHDTELAVQIVDLDHPFAPSAGGWRAVGEPGVGTLEMKFCGASPSWMKWVVKSESLKRTSYSKYTHGAVLVGDLPWARRERGELWTP